jgi:hypothetical protein
MPTDEHSAHPEHTRPESSLAMTVSKTINLPLDCVKRFKELAKGSGLSLPMYLFELSCDQYAAEIGCQFMEIIFDKHDGTCDLIVYLFGDHRFAITADAAEKWGIGMARVALKSERVRATDAPSNLTIHKKRGRIKIDGRSDDRTKPEMNVSLSCNEAHIMGLELLSAASQARLKAAGFSS